MGSADKGLGCGGSAGGEKQEPQGGRAQEKEYKGSSNFTLETITLSGYP